MRGRAHDRDGDPDGPLGQHVVGELRRGGEVVEQASVTLPYVPVESSRSGALVVRSEPGSGELDVRATAYDLP